MSARSRGAALFAIAAAAFALRLWGARFGATQPLARPDEEFFSIGAMGLFAHSYGGLGNGWPEGYTALWHLVLRAERAFYGDANLACLLAVRPLAIYLPARALSAAVGAATIFPVYGLARGWGAGAAGLCAALTFALNPLSVRDGHFAVSDALLCLLVALCLWAGARGRLVWAGVFAGAALGIKYAAAGLVVPCGLYALQALRRGERPWKAIALPVFAALVAFVAVSPAVLRDPGAFWSGLQTHGARYGGSALGFYAGTVIPAAFGWIGLAIACAGLLLALLGPLRQRALPSAAFAIVFLLALLAPLAVPYARYASPLVPVLAAGAGVALAFTLERSAWLLAALLLASLFHPAVLSAQFDRLLSREDTRDLAARWLIERGRPVESLGGWAHVHALEGAAQQACAASLPEHLRTPVPTLAGETRPWRVLTGRGVPGWEELGHALIRPSLNRVPAGEAEFVVESRPAPDFVNLAAAPTLDAQCWPEVARFLPGAPGMRESHDAFFVPLASLSGVERAGPEVVVRRRACGNSEAPRSR